MKIGLKEIVAQYLDAGDQSSHAFRRMYQIGIRGVRLFNMDIYGSFKTIVLDVGANKTVELPDDFIAFSKIGVLNESGEISSLSQNNSLISLADELKTSLKLVSDPYNSSPTRDNSIWFNYSYYGVGYNIYGISYGGYSIGEYKINETDGLITLSHDWIYPQLVLEYLSNGLDCETDDYMIDIRASECFLCFLRWGDAQDNRKKFGRNEVPLLKREYYREKRLAKMRINPTIVSEMQKVFRSNIRLTAKA